MTEDRIFLWVYVGFRPTVHHRSNQLTLSDLGQFQKGWIQCGFMSSLAHLRHDVMIPLIVGRCDHCEAIAGQ